MHVTRVKHCFGTGIRCIFERVQYWTDMNIIGQVKRAVLGAKRANRSDGRTKEQKNKQSVEDA